MTEKQEGKWVHAEEGKFLVWAGFITTGFLFLLGFCFVLFLFCFGTED
jgi:hypothetical protein